MVRPTNKASDTERELRAYSDELGIRRHAERIEEDLGDRPRVRGSRRRNARHCRAPPTVPLIVIKPNRK